MSIFFFSSRRRHTRFSRDWSSDVCSSDLGWGKIAHDSGLNLGKVVSNAHHSSKATSHSQNIHSQKLHGKSASKISKSHGSKMDTMRGVNHGSSFRTAHTGFHGTHGMGRMGGMGHGTGSMGHGGHGR